MGDRKTEEMICGLLIQFWTSLEGAGGNGTTLGLPEVDLLGPQNLASDNDVTLWPNTP